MKKDQNREQQVAEWKHLTESVLPALARQHGWPLRLDHCFKRVTLDHAFSDIWYKHLRKPAERHLAGEPLARALACAHLIAQEGQPVLKLRNQESLTYRGKARG